MKTIVIRPNSVVDLLEVDKPAVKENFALIKVHTAPMCTEFYHYRDGTESTCLGHEAAGEVVEIDRPGKVKVGDRVVVMPQYPCGKCALCKAGDYIHCENVVDPYEICNCNTGIATYSQYVIKQDWLLIPIPDGMSYDIASMACCGLGASFGAVQRLNIDSRDTVLISGLGPVGLGAVINCVSRGARVIGIARNKYRSGLAVELGASLVLSPNDPHLMEKLNELGADKSIECSGRRVYQRICIEGTRRRGEVAFVGESGDLAINISDDLIRKGLVLHGSWHWNLKDTGIIMDTIATNTDSIGKLITHKFPLFQAEKAFELQISGNCGKVVLHPWD